MYRNPSFAKRLIDRVAETNLGIIKQILLRGIDVLAVSDDVADSNSPLFPLGIFKKFFFPHIEKLVAECRRRGVLLLRHSDGNLYPLLDEWVSLGIQGVHPIQPGVMDLADVKRRYGERLVLRGNVDCGDILSFGSEEAVRRDVRRCVDAAAAGGGFILAESNSMHSNVKTENIPIMIDETKRYGRYPSASQ
jgi:uroporphyrinogen decarboxylase